MTKRTDKPVKPVTKPFLTGEMTDESTPRSALIFFGCLLLAERTAVRKRFHAGRSSGSAVKKARRSAILKKGCVSTA